MPEEPLVKLADVVKPVEPAPKPMTSSLAPSTPPGNSLLWSYSAPKNAKPKEPEPVQEYTPGFDFSEKVDVEGKERKIELAPSGLYVFDKKEKFDKPKAELPMKYAAAPQRGAWVAIKHPMSSGRVLVSAPSKASDFRTVKIRGKDIKGILGLTQPKKR